MKYNLPSIKNALFALTLLVIAERGIAQQYIIQDVNNTRPDQNRREAVSNFSSFGAEREHGYNAITFSVASQDDARKYVVEYTVNGTDYRTAGELTPSISAGAYTFNHYTEDDQPMMYRIRSESLQGRYAYSKNFMVDGTPNPPVRVWPTSITGNTMNVNATWEISRINIFSPDGTQVFAKDINGQADNIPVVIPELGKGMYFVNFLGDGWMYTTRILVP